MRDSRSTTLLEDDDAFVVLRCPALKNLVPLSCFDPLQPGTPAYIAGYSRAELRHGRLVFEEGRTALTGEPFVRLKGAELPHASIGGASGGAVTSISGVLQALIWGERNDVPGSCFALPLPRDVAKVLARGGAADACKVLQIGRRPPPAGKCIGRDAALREVLDLVAKRPTVGLTGVRGVGKSLLLSVIFHQFAKSAGEETLVWYGIPSDSPPDLMQFCQRIGRELGLDASEFNEASPFEAADILAKQVVRRDARLFIDQFENSMGEHASEEILVALNTAINGRVANA